jgi:hypothetical protein
MQSLRAPLLVSFAAPVLRASDANPVETPCRDR